MAEVATRPGGLELLAELEKAGAVTATSLDLDPSLSYDRWESLGAMFGSLHRSACWLIGDWLNFGERVYGETYAQGAEATGLSPDTLMHYSWVARQIPPERRNPFVPFSSHRIVAALEPAEQELWLKRVEDEGWTRRELLANLDPGSRNGGEAKKRRSKVDDDLEQHLDDIKKLLPRWESRFVDSCSGREARRRVRVAQEIAEWLTTEYVPAHAALVTPLAKVPT